MADEPPGAPPAAAPAADAAAGGDGGKEAAAAAAIQAAMRTGKEPLPKTEKASLPVPQIPAGKVAAKAA